MNSQNSRFYFTEAEESDSEELLEILEDDVFQGGVSLIYTRRPNAYESLKRAGEKVVIAVCRDSGSGRIVGFGACAINNCFIDGSEQKVGYLFGLRARKEYRRQALLHRAYDYLRDLVKAEDIRLFVTTILADNLYAQRLLEKRRAIMPTYSKLVDYNVYTVGPSRFEGKGNYIFRRAERSDIPSIIEFLNEQGKNTQFFPVLREVDLLPETAREISYKDMYLLYSGETMLACGACWDQGDHKQYIIKRYSGLYSWLRPAAVFLPYLGYPALPAEGSRLKIFTLSFWRVKDNSAQVFAEFINRLRGLMEYPYMNIGLCANDGLVGYMKSVPHFLYRSKVYSVELILSSTGTGLNDIKRSYLECGRL